MLTGAIKKTGVYVLVLVLAVPHNSCTKDWLNEKTNKNLAVPSGLNDFQTLMDNTDVMNDNSCGIGEIGSDGHLVIPLYWQYERSQEHNAYTWTHENPVTSTADWNAPYKRVAYCNQVLEGLGGLNPGNATDRQWWNALKGEALFQRARTFFELAQVYAPAYLEPAPSGNWGIPLRLTTDIHEASVRATVKQTYDRVIIDLMAAKDLLPVTPAYKTRASRPAALAELARVYLGMEAYDSAYAYADSCLRLYNSLLDYNTLDTQQHASLYYPVPYFNSEVIFHSTLVKWGNITADAMIDSALYALYDANDLRRAVFFDHTNPYIRFRGSYYGDQVLFSGLAVDEEYLIRAECHVRLGHWDKGMNDVNTLLLKRYTGHFTPLAAADSAEALAIILRERRKELLLRGLRWTDLRRLNHDPAGKGTITRFVDGKTYMLEPGSFRYTCPIPDDILQVSGIAQNPGW